MTRTVALENRYELRAGPAEPLGGKPLLLIFAVAFSLRAGWGIARLVQHGGPVLEFPDEQQYWLMAQSLASGGGLVDELGFRATRMPLYPSLLALFALLPGGLYVAVTFHWLLGAAAAVLTAKLGEAVGGRRIGLLSGLAVSVDPFLVFFSSLLLTETPFITALSGLWCALARIISRGPTVRAWALAGVVGAVCVYLRESALPLVLVAFLAMALGASQKTSWSGAAIAACMIVLSLLPWAARNRAVTGSFTLLTHRGGISLYDGVRPDATGGSDLGRVKQMPAVRDLGEVEWNRYFIKESLRDIQENPARICRLAAIKVARTWNPVPNAEDYRSPLVRAIGAAWSVPLFGLALLGTVKLANRPRGARLVLLLALPAIYIALLHALFVGSVRYRLPAMPMFAVLAVCGLANARLTSKTPHFPAAARDATKTTE